MTLGTLRSFTHPILFRYLLKRTIDKSVTTRVNGFELKVLPTVFHPRYFGSSRILARFIESLNLEGKRFLDMGTGSGIVALCAARSGASVTAVDINPAAVNCATQNAAAAGLAIDCWYSDLFAALPDERFDVIAWNPPFYPRRPRNVAEAAIHAGEDYALIERFAREASSHLASGGKVFLVLSMDVDVARFESLFRSHGFTVTRAQSRWWGLGETMVVIEFV